MLGENSFKREYLGIPLRGQAGPFTWELYGTRRLAPPGLAFGPPAQEASFDQSKLPRPF